MTLNINKEKVALLVQKLQTLTGSGLSIEESLNKIYGKTDGSYESQNKALRAVVSANTPSSSELGAALMIIDSSITPLKIAILTKQLFDTPEYVVKGVLGAFPNYTALEMGNLLLHTALYPNMIYTEMEWALQAGEYPNRDIIAALNTIYGQPALPIEVSFSQPTIRQTNAIVQTGPETMHNNYYKNSWIMHSPRSSFIEIKYKHPKAGFSTVNLIMVHLTSMRNGKPGHSPIDIIVNGQMIQSNYNVGNGNYQKDNFNITNSVQEGNNTILLKFCNDASTNYWINNLKVEYVK